MWVIFKKKKKKEKSNKRKREGRERERERKKRGKFYIFYYFYFFLFLFTIYGNRIVRIRRGKKQRALLDEGYAWKLKIWDFTEFLIKIRKILCFGFSQIYGFLSVRIDRSIRSN